MSILNPVELENKIVEVTQHCHRGAELFRKKLDEYLTAEAECEHVKAHAFLQHSGPQTEKRHAAVIAAHPYTLVMNQAKVEFEYTKRRLEVCIAELAALQNLNRGVRTMYNAERGIGG